MTREIKFRTWDKKRKTMEFFPYVYFYNVDADMVAFCLDRGRPHIYIDDDDPSDENDFELMQYTGLKDKKGKEIYEGDIVKFSTRVTNVTSENLEVEWGPASGAWVVNSLEDLVPYFLYEAVRHYNPEVIGNIYENPELLKRK
jgi:uncharacterized phage protein (TIGR01671 family)